MEYIVEIIQKGSHENLPVIVLGVYGGIKPTQNDYYVDIIGYDHPENYKIFSTSNECLVRIETLMKAFPEYDYSVKQYDSKTY